MESSKKFLTALILISMLAVIACGSFCLIQGNMHKHCAMNSPQLDQSQVNSPEAKLDLKATPQLLAIIDPKEILESCRTKNVIIKTPHFSMLAPTLLHEHERKLLHSFTGSKDFI